MYAFIDSYIETQKEVLIQYSIGDNNNLIEEKHSKTTHVRLCMQLKFEEVTL